MATEDDGDRSDVPLVLRGAPHPTRWTDRLPKLQSRGPSKRARRRLQTPVGPFQAVDEFSSVFAEELGKALGARGQAIVSSDEGGIRISVGPSSVFIPRTEVVAMWDDLLDERGDDSRGTTLGNWSDSILGISTETELAWEHGDTDHVHNAT